MRVGHGERNIQRAVLKCLVVAVISIGRFDVAALLHIDLKDLRQLCLVHLIIPVRACYVSDIVRLDRVTGDHDILYGIVGHPFDDVSEFHNIENGECRLVFFHHCLITVQPAHLVGSFLCHGLAVIVKIGRVKQHPFFIVHGIVIPVQGTVLEQLRIGLGVSGSVFLRRDDIFHGDVKPDECNNAVLARVLDLRVLLYFLAGNHVLYLIRPVARIIGLQRVDGHLTDGEGVDSPVDACQVSPDAHDGKRHACSKQSAAEDSCRDQLFLLGCVIRLHAHFSFSFYDLSSSSSPISGGFRKHWITLSIITSPTAMRMAAGIWRGPIPILTLPA